MSILRPAVNQTAYLKAGIYGFAGSGKTFTATLMALGLSQDIGDGKPVAFFDTETGSDFMIPKFEQAGVELLVAKSRAFADLLTFVREAEETCSVAIIDSITHVWVELLSAFQKDNGVDEILFHHWGAIKEEWRGFTDLYLNSQLHIILCGRAGTIWKMEKNERGKKELIDSGTKMKAETEMGYEPSLLIEMERIKKSEEKRDSKLKGWIHRAYILKDRADLMHGEEIDDPTYESFDAVVKFLNVGGEHLGIDSSRTSEGMFGNPAQSRYERKKQVEITLEKIKNVFVEQGLDGTAKDDKKKRLALLTQHFNTNAWSEIERMKLEDLQIGLQALYNHFEPPPEPEAPADSEEAPVF
jgi:hypothetical protein